MTNDELRRAIAERLGWKEDPGWNKIGTWVAPDGTLWHHCPNWPEDVKAALDLYAGCAEWALGCIDGSHYVRIGYLSYEMKPGESIARLLSRAWYQHGELTKKATTENDRTA